MGDKHRESEVIKPFIKLKKEMGSEDIHYSLFYDGLPQEFKDMARQELNETEENKKLGLLKLRDFLNGKGISGVEDHLLTAVLRNCKYNMKKSEKKLMKYLQIQDMFTKRLQTADLKRIEDIINDKCIGSLPYRDKYGRVILYTTPYNVNFDYYDIDDGALAAFCLLNYALSFPMTSIAGITYIGECKTANLSVLYPILKGFRQHIMTFLNIPFRIGRVSLINENFIIRWGYNLIWPLLPSKIVQRIKFYGADIEGLQEIYNPALLPEEFGGSMGPLNPKFLTQHIINHARKMKSRKLLLQ